MPVLSSSNQKVLLDLARQAIEHATGRRGEVPSPFPQGAETAPLQQKAGCFVTLWTKSGDLRGCIGTFERDKPLAEQVIRMSISAATQDPRFKPLEKWEVETVRIEISVLGELQRISSIEQVEVGKHGIYIVYGKRSGTYLPDVATSQRWNARQFVEHCASEKAGLSSGDLAKAELYVYEIQKISE